MNVLMTAPYFAGLTGSNSDYVDLACKLVKRGHNVYVICTHAHGNELTYETLEDVKIFRFRPILHISSVDYGISFPIIKICKFIRQFKIDVVHSICAIVSITLASAIASRITKTPLILTIQGAEKTTGIASIDVMQKIWDKSAGKIISSVTFRTILLSKYLLSRAIELGISPSKTVIIPNGIDIEKFGSDFDSDKVKESLGFNADNIIIGFTGRFVPLKGIEYLIRALKIVKKDIPNIGLLMIGDGPLHNQIKLKLNDIPVKITGWVNRSQVSYYLNAIDIFVLPSLTEGVPVAILEAMAMEKSIIATNVGGIPDIVKNSENGYLVPPYDSLSIAKYIKILACNETLRQRMGKRSLEMVRKNYQWETQVGKIEKLYLEAKEGFK